MGDRGIRQILSGHEGYWTRSFQLQSNGRDFAVLGHSIYSRGRQHGSLRIRRKISRQLDLTCLRRFNLGVRNTVSCFDLRLFGAASLKDVGVLILVWDIAKPGTGTIPVKRTISENPSTPICHVYVVSLLSDSLFHSFGPSRAIGA